jgi:hypothetical protein
MTTFDMYEFPVKFNTFNCDVFASSFYLFMIYLMILCFKIDIN